MYILDFALAITLNLCVVYIRGYHLYLHLSKLDVQSLCQYFCKLKTCPMIDAPACDRNSAYFTLIKIDELYYDDYWDGLHPSKVKVASVFEL